MVLAVVAWCVTASVLLRMWIGELRERRAERARMTERRFELLAQSAAKQHTETIAELTERVTKLEAKDAKLSIAGARRVP